MNSKNFGAALDRLGHAAKKTNGTRVRLGIVVGTGGRPFDDPPSGPSGGAGSHRGASGTPDPAPDPAEYRIDKPRSTQQGRTGAHDPERSLELESVNGAGVERAMETSDPMRPYGDKTLANNSIPTGSHPADAPDAATLTRVADCVQAKRRASLGDIVRFTGLDMMATLRAAATLTQDGRVSFDRGDYVWAAEASTAAKDCRDAALGILRELGGADEIVWRNECETSGYCVEPNEFREIVEELVTDGLVRVHYEDPRWAEERHDEALYMRFGGGLDLDEVIEVARERDPDGSITAMYENPPMYEAADM